MTPDPKKIPRPWLKHYDKHVPASLVYPQESLPELFGNSCAENTHRVALQFLGKSLRYGQIEASATAFAAHLAEQGIHKGDRVFMMLPNSPHFVIAYYAILKIGAVAVPGSWSFFLTCCTTRCQPCCSRIPISRRLLLT
jgi:long-chain acyl-CoA synthetase